MTNNIIEIKEIHGTYYKFSGGYTLYGGAYDVEYIEGQLTKQVEEQL